MDQMNLPDNLLPEPKPLFNYRVQVRITDRYRKPSHLQFQKTHDRVNWTETVEADGFEDKASANCAVIGSLTKWWPTKQYDLEIISTTQKP